MDTKKRPHPGDDKNRQAKRRKLAEMLEADKAEAKPTIKPTQPSDTNPTQPQTKHSQKYRPEPKKKEGLLDKMRAKLESGRFRSLNESLYTTTGEEAFEMFSSDPELFEVVSRSPREIYQHAVPRRLPQSNEQVA